MTSYDLQAKQKKNRVHPSMTPNILYMTHLNDFSINNLHKIH